MLTVYRNLIKIVFDNFIGNKSLIQFNKNAFAIQHFLV